MRKQVKKQHYWPHQRVPVHLDNFETARKLKTLEQKAAEAAIP